MKRHKHKTNTGFGKNGITPPAFKRLGLGDIVRGNGVYHPTKGWRVMRKYVPHTLLDSVLKSIGLLPLNA